MDNQDIISGINVLYAGNLSRPGAGGWRAVGKILGISGPYAREIALGIKPLTINVATAWLIATGASKAQVLADVCPDCGNLHTGRCHGEPGAVAWIKPDQAIIKQPSSKPRRRRKRKGVSISLDLWERMNRERKAAGLTWDEYLGGTI